jgi:hypothetical protein
LTLEVADTLLAATAVADKGMNRWVSNGEVITQWIEAGVTAGINDFRPAAAALAIGPGQYIQFGALGEEGAIAITLRALSRRLRLQVAWPASLAEEVMPPTADATTVFGPDVDDQADEDEQDTFEGSWIELHELNG